MTVSCILGTYNGSRYVTDTVQSLIRQTHPPDELLISDDCSSDETLAIVSRIQEQNPGFPIRVLDSNQNRGVNGNYELLLRECTGDVICIVDQDDIWHPNKIDVLLKAMAGNADSLFTDAELIDDTGTLIDQTLWQYHRFDPVRDKDLVSRIALSNVVTGSTLALHRSALDLVLPFPEFDEVLYDEWIAIILSSVGSIRPLADKVMQYRLHDSQFTSSHREEVEPGFPFNIEAYLRPIRFKHQLFTQVAHRLQQLGTPNKAILEALKFWSARARNATTLSLVDKLRLSSSFIERKYSRFTRSPGKNFIKDMIITPLLAKKK